jgi:hypothetical protein
MLGLMRWPHRSEFRKGEQNVYRELRIAFTRHPR